MSLLTVIRSAVKIADAVTKPLQAVVSYERYTGQDMYGTKQYAGVKSLRVIVDAKQRPVRSVSGEMVIARLTITFLDAAALAIASNNDGVLIMDRITLANGSTGPILNVGGLVDAGTWLPFATEAYIG